MSLRNLLSMLKDITIEGSLEFFKPIYLKEEQIGYRFKYLKYYGTNKGDWKKFNCG
jgi:hypothetical protein